MTVPAGDDLTQVYLTPTLVAGLLHVSTKTLEAWRRQGCGPPFFKVGRSVRYAYADIHAFMTCRRVTSTAEYHLPIKFIAGRFPARPLLLLPAPPRRLRLPAPGH